jgi:hypothetical protein
MRARTLARLALWIFAVAGWLLFAIVTIRATPLFTDGAAGPTGAVSAFASARINVLKSAEQNWTSLIALSTGQASLDLAAQAATKPGSMPDLDFTTDPEVSLIWAEGGSAMVSLHYASNRGGEVNEVHLLRFLDGAWKIERFWRVIPDPGSP